MRSIIIIIPLVRESCKGGRAGPFFASPTKMEGGDTSDADDGESQLHVTCWSGGGKSPELFLCPVAHMRYSLAL